MKLKKCDFIKPVAENSSFLINFSGRGFKYCLCILLFSVSFIVQSKDLKAFAGNEEVEVRFPETTKANSFVSGMTSNNIGKNPYLSYSRSVKEWSNSNPRSVAARYSLAALAPGMVVTGSLTAFTSCAGTVSVTQTIAISGTELIADVDVNAPAGYELSTAPGGTFSTVLSLTPTAGTLSATNIYVRLSSSAVNGARGNIVCTSTGAANQNVATGIATVNTTPASTPGILPLLQCTGFTNYFNGPSACGENNALNFSGSSFGTRNLLYNGIDNLTMEIWAKWSGTIANGAAQILFYNGHTGNGGYGILMKPNGTLEILIGGKAYLTSSAKLTAGIWQHVAIVRNARTWSLYLDGIQYSVSPNTTDPASPSASSGNNTSIGSGENNNHQFYGSLDEAKFWTVVRNTAQIQSDMKECTANPTAGLLAYWSFGEGSGTNAADGSGYGNGLNLTNTSWTTSGAPTGATYFWDFGDGMTASTAGATHVYNTAGPKTVTLTVTNLNGCSSTSTSELTVNQSPTASITGTAESCATPVTLTASGGVSYQWSGGNSPNTATNTFNTSGYYTVTVTNASGCTATASQAVTVNALPALPNNGALPQMADFAAGFSSPGGVAFDGLGNLLLAESIMGSIKKISNTGLITTFKTGINRPYGLAFDGSGNLYVSEQNNQTIKKITPEGVISTLTAEISNPRGLAFDGSGNLFVATQTGNIFKVAPDGTLTTVVTGLGSAVGLAYRSGFLFVSEQTSSSVKKVTAEGVISTFANGLNRPGHLAFDGSGNLYISEINAIKKATPEGVLSTFISGLSSVEGLAFDASGSMYAANNRQKVSKITFPAANITSVGNSGSVILTASPSVGETVDWFDAAIGGDLLLSGSTIYTTPTITTTTTYYAESRNTITGCVSATRTAIKVNVNIGLSMYGSKVSDNISVLNKNGKIGESGLSINGQILHYKPTLAATSSVSSISSSTAESGGTITSNGGLAILARGVCWSLSGNPTIADNKTVEGNSQSFTSNLSGLASGTTYYVRAYATNGLGTSYGTEASFTTL